MRRYHTKEFIEKARAVHGDKYEYAKTDYINIRNKVEIVCPTHGSFWQKPDNHINGQGCSKCSGKCKLNTETFIIKAINVHGDKYVYDNTEYVNSHTKVAIFCTKHGHFQQTPANHLSGAGCPRCKADARKNTAKEFIEKARAVHGDKYEYAKTDYINIRNKVEIVCPTHGSFLQTPHGHLKGYGCKSCSVDSNKSNTEEFVERARVIHSDKYDYSLVKYTNKRTKVEIVCPTHGSFWQRPTNHLSGRGCAVCSSSKGELAVLKILKKHNIPYVQQWWYPDDDRRYRYDFYLPEQNIIIEFHGGQHYTYVEYFHSTEDRFQAQKSIDRFKSLIAKERNIPLIELKNIKYKDLTDPGFETMLLHVIGNINNRLNPSCNSHLVISKLEDSNKYNMQFYSY